MNNRYRSTWKVFEKKLDKQIEALNRYLKTKRTKRIKISKEAV